MEAKILYRLSNRHNRINSNYDAMRMDVPQRIIDEDDRLVALFDRDNLNDRIDDLDTIAIRAWMNSNVKAGRMHDCITKRTKNVFNSEYNFWFFPKPDRIFQY